MEKTGQIHLRLIQTSTTEALDGDEERSVTTADWRGGTRLEKRAGQHERR